MLALAETFSCYYYKFLFLFISLAEKIRINSTSAPKKIEVFVDDKKVLVDPNITVLQVGL